MSNARNLADVISGNYDVPSAALGNAPETDLTPVKQDLALLAFQSARNDNQVAFNLGNAFVDQFENESGIDTKSSISRSSGDYMFSGSQAAGLIINKWRVHTLGQPASCTWQVGWSNNGSNWTNIGSTANTQVNSTWTNYFTFTNTTPRKYWRWYKTTTSSGGGYHTELEIYDGDTNLTSQISGSQLTHNGLVSWNANNFVDGNTGSIAFHTDSSGGGSFWRLDASSNTSNTTSASGNFTGTTQSSSSSVSEMSIIVMYENNVGTATLNTDIVVQVSANNGTDWTTVTLSDAPNLTSSIKVAKTASIAVTAGTQPKYKISLANQAAGSKITRIQGVSLLY